MDELCDRLASALKITDVKRLNDIKALLYADDVALIAHSRTELQKMKSAEYVLVEAMSPSQVAGAGVMQGTLSSPTESNMKEVDDNSDACKLFVGGIPWLTTDERFKQHFSQFGTVMEAIIVRDSVSKLSRGYGFLTFKDPESVTKALAHEQVMDGRKIDCKMAAPTFAWRRRGGGGEHVRKLFVGGLPRHVSSSMLAYHFGQYGQLLNAVVMLDRRTGLSRGFGFVTFAESSSIEAVLATAQIIEGKVVECSKALSREHLKKHQQQQRRRIMTPRLPETPHRLQPATADGPPAALVVLPQDVSPYLPVTLPHDPSTSLPALTLPVEAAPPGPFLAPSFPFQYSPHVLLALGNNLHSPHSFASQPEYRTAPLVLQQLEQGQAPQYAVQAVGGLHWSQLPPNTAPVPGHSKPRQPT
eukprot:g71932.t1